MSPIGGANGIGWDENSPPATEGAGSGNARMQSIKTSVRQGLDSEHAWPSAGGDGVGYHRYGSARHFYGTESQVSSSGSEGRTMLTSDTSRLFAVGSGGTVFLGGPAVLSIASFPGSTPQRSHWQQEIGYGVTSASGQTTLTFPNSGFSGIPLTHVQLINQTASQLSGNYSLSVQTVDGASAIIWSIAASTGNMAAGVPFLWFSLGTRVL